MALTAARRLSIQGTPTVIPMKMAASQTIYNGGGVMLTSGLAVPAADTASSYNAGVAILEPGADKIVSAATGDYYVPVAFNCVVKNLKATAATEATYVGFQVCWTNDETCDVIGTTSNDVPAGICVGYNSATSIDVYIVAPNGENW